MALVCSKKYYCLYTFVELHVNDIFLHLRTHAGLCGVLQ